MAEKIGARRSERNSQEPYSRTRLDRARRIATEGTSEAKQEGDNYGLSVWREIKVVLTAKADS
jgi:hypothetical protein